MSLKRDYKTKTDDEKELEPLGGPKSPDKESKTNGVQFGEYFSFPFKMNKTKRRYCLLNSLIIEISFD